MKYSRVTNVFYHVNTANELAHVSFATISKERTAKFFAVPWIWLSITLASIWMGCTLLGCSTDQPGYVSVEKALHASQRNMKPVAVLFYSDRNHLESKLVTIFKNNPPLLESLNALYNPVFFNIDLCKNVSIHGTKLDAVCFYSYYQVAPFNFALFTRPVAPQIVILSPTGVRLNPYSWVHVSDMESISHWLTHGI